MSRRRGWDFSVIDWALSRGIDGRLWLVQNKIQIYHQKLMRNFCSPPADVARYIADSPEISNDVVTRLFAWSYRTHILTAACSGNKPLPGRRVLLLRPENMQCRGGKYPKKLLAGVPEFDPGRGDMFPCPTILSRSFFKVWYCLCAFRIHNKIKCNPSAHRLAVAIVNGSYMFRLLYDSFLYFSYRQAWWWLLDVAKTCSYHLQLLQWSCGLMDYIFFYYLYRSAVGPTHVFCTKGTVCTACGI
jgi:hypothetical protein